MYCIMTYYRHCKLYLLITHCLLVTNTHAVQLAVRILFNLTSSFLVLLTLLIRFISALVNCVTQSAFNK